jgi:small subunit ribosomal protein S21e
VKVRFFSIVNCSSSTNRLITSKDVASVQLSVGHVDENGVCSG